MYSLKDFFFITMCAFERSRKGMKFNMKVVISGSFRKHLQDIIDLKTELEKKGITVLKPDKIKKVDNIDRPEFVKFEGRK